MIRDMDRNLLVTGQKIFKGKKKRHEFKFVFDYNLQDRSTAKSGFLLQWGKIPCLARQCLGVEVPTTSVSLPSHSNHTPLLKTNLNVNKSIFICIETPSGVVTDSWARLPWVLITETYIAGLSSLFPSVWILEGEGEEDACCICEMQFWRCGRWPGWWQLGSILSHLLLRFPYSDKMEYEALK